MTTSTSAETPDFVALFEHYKTLKPGQKAELRRATALDDLLLQPTLYRLFPGIRPGPRQLRLAFLLPWAAHRSNAPSLGAQCAQAGIREARMFQIARSDPPMDLIQLRRLIIQLKPQLDWADFGNSLWYWGQRAKRDLIETYYLANPR